MDRLEWGVHCFCVSYLQKKTWASESRTYAQQVQSLFFVILDGPSLFLDWTVPPRTESFSRLIEVHSSQAHFISRCPCKCSNESASTDFQCIKHFDVAISCTEFCRVTARDWQFVRTVPIRTYWIDFPAHQRKFLWRRSIANKEKPLGIKQHKIWSLGNKT